MNFCPHREVCIFSVLYLLCLWQLKRPQWSAHLALRVGHKWPLALCCAYLLSWGAHGRPGLQGLSVRPRGTRHHPLEWNPLYAWVDSQGSDRPIRYPPPCMQEPNYDHLLEQAYKLFPTTVPISPIYKRVNSDCFHLQGSRATSMSKIHRKLHTSQLTNPSQ